MESFTEGAFCFRRELHYGVFIITQLARWFNPSMLFSLLISLKHFFSVCSWYKYLKKLKNIFIYYFLQIWRIYIVLWKNKLHPVLVLRFNISVHNNEVVLNTFNLKWTTTKAKPKCRGNVWKTSLQRCFSSLRFASAALFRSHSISIRLRSELWLGHCNTLILFIIFSAIQMFCCAWGHWLVAWTNVSKILAVGEMARL